MTVVVGGVECVGAFHKAFALHEALCQRGMGVDAGIHDADANTLSDGVYRKRLVRADHGKIPLVVCVAGCGRLVRKLYDSVRLVPYKKPGVAKPHHIRFAHHVERNALILPAKIEAFFYFHNIPGLRLLRVHSRIGIDGSCR